MSTLINIDNGGTLTDICVWDGGKFTFTKTLTTPHDLSQCLFDGIENASTALYGAANTERLLHATQHVRYSTTQGTNALVERRGPMIGILTSMPDLIDDLQSNEEEQHLFEALIDDRHAHIDLSPESGTDVDFEVVQLVNRLTTQGAARVVVACATKAEEHRLRSVLLRKFPATSSVRSRSSTAGTSPVTVTTRDGPGPASSTRSCTRRWSASSTGRSDASSPTGSSTRCSSTATTAPLHGWPSRWPSRPTPPAPAAGSREPLRSPAPTASTTSS